MKSIRVVAAIIIRDGLILATQRGYGEYRDGWEFPGGKVEPGESEPEALVREIEEELAVRVEVIRHLTTISYDYPAFHLEMACFVCTIAEGEPKLIEHEAARWLAPEDIDSVAWLPADVLVVDELKRQGVV